MNINEFLNKIVSKFKEFDVDDIETTVSKPNNSLLIPIIDNDMPKYKIAVSFIDEGYLSIYTCFKHNAVLKNELFKLLKLINEFNTQSFLNFSIDKNYIKISYNMPEITDEDILQVVKVISLIPNVIYEFYQDMKEFLK